MREEIDVAISDEQVLDDRARTPPDIRHLRNRRKKRRARTVKMNYLIVQRQEVIPHEQSAAAIRHPPRNERGVFFSVKIEHPGRNRTYRRTNASCNEVTTDMGEEGECDLISC